MDGSIADMVQISLILGGGFVLWSAVVWTAASGLHRALRLAPEWAGYWGGALVLAGLPLGIGIITLLVPEALSFFALSGSTQILADPQTGPLRLTLRDSGPIEPVWSLPDSLAAIALLVFAAVTLIRLASMMRGFALIRQLIASGTKAPSDLAAAVPACGVNAQTVRVLIVRDAPTAFALGGRHPVIVLPDHLVTTLSHAQMRMIVAHEAAHIARGDADLRPFLAFVEALFWFNPFIRLMVNRLELAAELACDGQALSGEAAPARRLYAQALLRALRVQTARRTFACRTTGEALPRLPAALTPHPLRSEKMRVLSILHGLPPGRKGTRWSASLGIVALLAGLGAGLAQAEVLARTSGDGLLPVDLGSQAWVSSRYGKRKDPRDGKLKKHHGIDVAAPAGTPLLAPADGTVISTADKGEKSYGKYLKIDHGNDLTIMYANLGEMRVATGDAVAAGDTIAIIGVSGRSTGPHVHIETYLKDERVDPEKVLDLSAMPDKKPRKDD